MVDAQIYEPRETHPDSRGDRIATALMMLGALAAVAGFAVLFSLWWRGSNQDDYEVLRIASQEFVDGHPIVAGKLAESVDFEQARSAERDFADSRDKVSEPSDPISIILAKRFRDRSKSSDSDSGNTETATQLAAREEGEKRTRWAGLRDFLVGVGRVASANRETDLRRKRRLLHDAIPVLESAQEHGFPAGRMAQGYRILGETLFNVGRYDDAISAFEKAIEQDPTARRDLLPMLAESQLSAVAPLKSEALQTIENFLSDRALQEMQRWEGELIRLRVMLALRMYGEVRTRVERELLAKAPTQPDLHEIAVNYRDSLALLTSIADVKQAMERRGDASTRGEQIRPFETAGMQRTMRRIRELQRDAAPHVAAQARLWSARALLLQGRESEALAELSAVRQQRPFGAEAIVGGLEEIELLARIGRGPEVLVTTRSMMRELGDDRNFDASLITFDEFRRRIIGAIEQLRENGDFNAAIDTARTLPPVFDVIEALTQEGIGFREWAEATLARGTDISGEVTDAASEQSRVRFRAAGDAFAKAAEIQFSSDEYVSTQWSAIEALQQGGHFSQSIRLLRNYLRYEKRGRMSRGLVAYGRALLAEDEPSEAIDVLTTCIVEYPRDPLRYDARLLSALAFAEMGHIDDARDLLQDNLEDGELTPQSPAWRDSLFTLGELLYEKGFRNHLLAQQSPLQDRTEQLQDNQPVLEEAARRLDEAVERYWPIARAESAAYLAARVRVMSAQWPQLESQSADVLHSARRTLLAESEQRLQRALNGFVRLRRHLIDQEEEKRLRRSEQSILRNCLLAEADVLREMSRWEDASSAYRTVELRYMNEPPALEAILGRARCARILGRAFEADRLIQQAMVVLQRIPPEMNDRFAETTRYDRGGWEQLLGWMNQRDSTSGA